MFIKEASGDTAANRIHDMLRCCVGCFYWPVFVSYSQSRWQRNARNIKLRSMLQTRHGRLARLLGAIQCSQTATKLAVLMDKWLVCNIDLGRCCTVLLMEDLSVAPIIDLWVCGIVAPIGRLIALESGMKFRNFVPTIHLIDNKSTLPIP